MEEKNKRILFAFDIEEDLKKEIKVRAALRNITMSQWMRRAIVRQLESEFVNIKEENGT